MKNDKCLIFAFFLIVLFNFINCQKNNEIINEDNRNIDNENTELIPLLIDLNYNEEILLEGQIILFNGWEPNIRMITDNNKIIGIIENSVSKEFINKFFNYSTTGNRVFKLKYINMVNLPYYDTPLMVFEIIEYF
ncbi:MAG: hypothetical protein FWD28_01770 [Treponema sp.]|nr:hypothetical protein [Treponema sp.]